MIEILHVPDCPGLPLLLSRLAEVAVTQVATRVVETEEQAVARGSPALLVDGVDPFPQPDAPVGLWCRLYRDGPAPSVEELPGIFGRGMRLSR